jgi:hypothetical protein
MVVCPFEDGRHGTCGRKGEAARGKADSAFGGGKQHLGCGRATDHEMVRRSRYIDRRTEEELAPAPSTGRTQVLSAE